MQLITIRSDKTLYAGCLFQKRNNDAGETPAIVNPKDREKWREFHFLDFYVTLVIFLILVFIFFVTLIFSGFGLTIDRDYYLI